MRLDWAEVALQQLEAIAARAPVQANQVLTEVERLAHLPFPSRFRHLKGGRADEHALPVPPHVVIYTAGDRFVRVLAIVDGRRRTDPW